MDIAVSRCRVVSFKVSRFFVRLAAFLDLLPLWTLCHGIRQSIQESLNCSTYLLRFEFLYFFRTRKLLGRVLWKETITQGHHPHVQSDIHSQAQTGEMREIRECHLPNQGQRNKRDKRVGRRLQFRMDSGHPGHLVQHKDQALLHLQWRHSQMAVLCLPLQ